MAHNTQKEKVCIKTTKVYDWILRNITIPTLVFSNTSGLEELGFNCHIHTYGGYHDYDDPCQFLNPDGLSIKCYLTDSCGEMITNLKDQKLAFEVTPNTKRQNIKITKPNGKTLTLQKVEIVVKGYLVIVIEDVDGYECTSKPIPFSTMQTFYLCAPEGTSIHAQVTNFESKAVLCCSKGFFEQLLVNINFCLDIQAEAIVKLQIEGEICKQREEILADICPKPSFPKQCPTIFPIKS